MFRFQEKMTEVEAMETDVAQKSVLPLFGQLGQVNAGTDFLIRD